MNLLNSFVVRSLPFIPKAVVGAVASRYIAGETLSDAVATVRRLNGEGAMATVDVLGEDIVTQDQATDSMFGSLEVLKAIAKHSLDSNLSVKLTSLGLKMERQFCIGNLDQIVTSAAKQNNFVRIDMEDHTCTDGTLELYRHMRGRHGNVGIVIQAYLHRSEEDVRRLAAEGANVRLCKGIYNEPPQVAIKDRAGIQRNYLFLLRILLDAGCYVGIATHDDVLIDGAKALLAERKVDRSRYEFQMLLGVRDERRKQLLAEGHRMRVYVPFGKDWYGYSTRRLKENPQMAGHVFKAMLGIGR